MYLGNTGLHDINSRKNETPVYIILSYCNRKSLYSHWSIARL